MKTVPLKTVKMGDNDLVYKDQIRIFVCIPDDIQRGANVDEMRRVIRILDVLDNLEDGATEFQLEDADFGILVNKMKNARFRVIDPVLVQFVEDVTGEE